MVGRVEKGQGWLFPRTESFSLGIRIRRRWRGAIVERPARPLWKIFAVWSSRTLGAFPIERALAPLTGLASLHAVTGWRRRFIPTRPEAIHQVFGKLRELLAIELAILVVVVPHRAFDEALW
jgi:hypothetical protein